MNANAVCDMVQERCQNTMEEWERIGEMIEDIKTRPMEVIESLERVRGYILENIHAEKERESDVGQMLDDWDLTLEELIKDFIEEEFSENDGSNR